MVRNYKRKTNRGLVEPEDVMKAVRAVRIDRVSLRQAAKAISISYGSLMRYVRKIPDSEVYDRSFTKPSCTVGYSRKPRHKLSSIAGSSVETNQLSSGPDGPRLENLSEHRVHEDAQEIKTESSTIPVMIKTEDFSESETEVLSVECDLLDMEDPEKHSEGRRDSPEMAARTFDDGLGMGTSSQSEEKLPWKFQDEYEVAGWVIGTKLRSLHPIQRALAEKLIYDVLSKAVLEDLNPHTSITDTTSNS
uniref:HTH psq-type domain-containing protein n=1 Tax=Lygus hesperus TaxID=30085 RepID=A0A146LWP3_LYGHE